MLKNVPAGSAVVLGVNKSQISQMVGQHRQNIRKLCDKFSLKELKVRAAAAEEGEVLLLSAEKH